MLTEKKRIINDLKKELGSTTEEIANIVNSQLEYTTRTMEHSGFETVMWPYFGKFLVKPGRLYHINKNKNGGIQRRQR